MQLQIVYPFKFTHVNDFHIYTRKYEVYSINFVEEQFPYKIKGQRLQ